MTSELLKYCTCSAVDSTSAHPSLKRVVNVRLLKIHDFALGWRKEAAMIFSQLSHAFGAIRMSSMSKSDLISKVPEAYFVDAAQFILPERYAMRL